MKAPGFLPSLAGVLLRFPEHFVAVDEVIERMFHQDRVRQKNSTVLSFLWINPGTPGSPDVYVMDVQVFGAASSTPIYSYVLREAARNCGSDLTFIINEVNNHSHVDNWLTSYPTGTEATLAARVVYDALLKDGFKLTKSEFISTSFVPTPAAR